jgi:hypothetical protein
MSLTKALKPPERAILESGITEKAVPNQKNGPALEEGGGSFSCVGHKRRYGLRNIIERLLGTGKALS